MVPRLPGVTSGGPSALLFACNGSSGETFDDPGLLISLGIAIILARRKHPMRMAHRQTLSTLHLSSSERSSSSVRRRYPPAASFATTAVALPESQRQPQKNSKASAYECTNYVSIRRARGGAALVFGWMSWCAYADESAWLPNRARRESRSPTSRRPIQ